MASGGAWKLAGAFYQASQASHQLAGASGCGLASAFHTNLGNLAPHENLLYAALPCASHHASIRLMHPSPHPGVLGLNDTWCQQRLPQSKSTPTCTTQLPHACPCQHSLNSHAAARQATMQHTHTRHHTAVVTTSRQASPPHCDQHSSPVQHPSSSLNTLSDLPISLRHTNQPPPCTMPSAVWSAMPLRPSLTLHAPSHGVIRTCSPATPMSASAHLHAHSMLQSIGTAMQLQSFSTQAEPPSSSVRGGVLAVLPAPLVPYAQLMRLDKPIGTWLLLWPSLWSIALAADPGQLPDLWMVSLFSVGALLLRGAGCTINDLWDRDLDKRVERTRGRPLASGAIQPWQAVAFLGLQLSLGLCILLQLNTYSQVLGASSLLLVGTYPLMKRVTYWPQAVLGLTINWGALLGWAAVKGECDLSVMLPLYLAGVCWSLVYDTIYAHQDKRDDVSAGVRSTALLFGDRTKHILSGFAAVQVACLVAAGMGAGVGPAYYAGVAGMGAHLAMQLIQTDLDNGPQCMETFVANKWAGAIMFVGCVAGRLVP